MYIYIYTYTHIDIYTYTFIYICIYEKSSPVMREHLCNRSVVNCVSTPSAAMARSDTFVNEISRQVSPAHAPASCTIPRDVTREDSEHESWSFRPFRALHPCPVTHTHT